MNPPSPFTNRLIHETSPYLRQHAHNPVDWFAWGPDALERSKREDKPIFLSIGYSACHWCHVMEHESFEDPETAAVMNEHFVNIKVDREERPDLDHIYMTAVQMMTRHGGWPMSVFLTPELEPFYGGTYFPPEPRYNMPSFRQILLSVADAWQNKRGEVTRSSAQLAGALAQMNQLTPGGDRLGLELIDRAINVLSRDFDPGYGGFGSAPKFPHPMDLKLCLRHWKRTGSRESLEMVELTLDHMARGGIYDHLAGGFHRYSTDERWLVPHFEKMLYDNALLTQVYIEAYQATGNVEFERVVRETLDYVLREMTSPEGGFYSTQDADSEGVEGKFFVWSPDEVEQVLGPQAAAEFCYVYDVSREGNWEDHNILNRPKTLDQCARLLKVGAAELEQRLALSRNALFSVRSRRVLPGRDEKVLVSWNGLMIDAMARGFQVLGDVRYLEAASHAAEFILSKMWNQEEQASRGVGEWGNGGGGGSAVLTPSLLHSSTPLLLHSYKDGRARFNAYLDDYATLIDCLVTLYESDFQTAWLSAALQLGEVMIEQFWDEAGGSFYYTGRDHETLITRVRDVHDSATPSGNSSAVGALLRLGKLTGRTDLVAKAERTLQSFAGVMAQQSRATGQMLLTLDSLMNHPVEFVIVAGDAPDSATETANALRMVRRQLIPNKVVAAPFSGMYDPAGGPSGNAITDQIPVAGECVVPLLADRKAIDGKITVYVCENYSCQAPVVGLDALAEALRGL